MCSKTTRRWDKKGHISTCVLQVDPGGFCYPRSIDYLASCTENSLKPHLQTGAQSMHEFQAIVRRLMVILIDNSRSLLIKPHFSSNIFASSVSSSITSSYISYCERLQCTSTLIIVGSFPPDNTHEEGSYLL